MLHNFAFLSKIKPALIRRLFATPVYRLGPLHILTKEQYCTDHSTSKAREDGKDNENPSPDPILGFSRDKFSTEHDPCRPLVFNSVFHIALLLYFYYITIFYSSF